MGNTFQNNIGNIEKAKIEIIDRRMREKGREKPVKIQGGKSVAFTPHLNLTQTAVGQAGMAGSLLGAQKGAKKIKGATKKVYVVQFNPSSLSIRARGPGFVPVLAYDENGKSSTPTEQRVRITVNVQLIFDQVDPYDAFMEEKTSFAPTDLALNVTKGIKTATGTKKLATVQQTVEGFIAALRSPNTRSITFYWGDMIYTGILNSVSAQYTMFNLFGQAIRAVLNLSLLSVQDDLVPNSLGMWEAAYKKAFEGDSFDAVRGTQTATNLLNLG